LLAETPHGFQGISVVKLSPLEVVVAARYVRSGRNGIFTTPAVPRSGEDHPTVTRQKLQHAFCLLDGYQDDAARGFASSFGFYSQQAILQ
jgi:hypothetical protein